MSLFVAHVGCVTVEMFSRDTFFGLLVVLFVDDAFITHQTVFWRGSARTINNSRSVKVVGVFSMGLASGGSE